jgi:hypothetical protein
LNRVSITRHSDCGEQEEAAVEAAGHKEGFLVVVVEGLAELGGDDEAAFPVDRMLVFSVEHRRRSQPLDFRGVE